MGFRSVFIADDYPIQWPDWFREKYADSLYFGEHGHLASRGEWKHYGPWTDLITDIQKVVPWKERPSFNVVFLHECGGVTWCAITKNEIRWAEPREWQETDGITHDYCYDCVQHNLEKG